MHHVDNLVIRSLDQLVAQADQLVIELRGYSVTPARTLLAAEEAAAGFRRKRRDMLDEMMLVPMGEC